MIDFTVRKEQASPREIAHDFAATEICPVAWDYHPHATWLQAMLDRFCLTSDQRIQPPVPIAMHEAIQFIIGDTAMKVATDAVRRYGGHGFIKECVTRPPRYVGQSAAAA